MAQRKTSKKYKKAKSKVKAFFNSRSKKSKTNIKLVLCLLFVAFAFTISIGEYVESPLPTWNDLFSLATGEQHVAVATSSIPNVDTNIHFIDVGQADATLIEQNGEFCLIDAGDLGNEDILIAYLNSAGVQQIDLLIMTHEHADHIGGMVDVMENFDVETVLLPDFAKVGMPDGYNILRTLEYIDISAIDEAVAKVGDVYMLGDAQITVLDTGLEDADNENNTSVVTMFETDNFRYLSCGDAEQEQSEKMIENGTFLSADVYKAAHHGAANGNYYEFINEIMPKVAVVSSGKDNSYGHPHDETLENLNNVGATIYNTANDGNVIISVTNSGEIYITTQNNGTHQIQNAA